MRLAPAELLQSLTAAQRKRLLAIVKAQKALPWKRGDDRLQRLKLVAKMTGPFNEPLAEISRDGWSVVNLMARGSNRHS